MILITECSTSIHLYDLDHSKLIGLGPTFSQVFFAGLALICTSYHHTVWTVEISSPRSIGHLRRVRGVFLSKIAYSNTIFSSTFSLALSVILHPPLLTRIILSAIILPSITLLTLLPLPRFQHGALRFALSSTGAFGVVLSISLLAGVDSWSDVWERLWVPDGPIVGFGLWGSGKEKGLSAAFCFLLSFGMICDWILRRRFGENPDQVGYSLHHPSSHFSYGSTEMGFISSTLRSKPP